MVPCFRLDEEFFASLTEADAEMARQVAAGGCPWCRGPLHQANYQRKARGGVFGAAGEGYAIRHSLCCGTEGCRRRTLPPSLRFMGRRVYLGAVVVLASVCHQLMALRDACAVTGVPAWTLRRWRRWWREAFPASQIWAELRARFRPPPPREDELPRSLLVRADEELEAQGGQPGLGPLCRLLAGWLAPSTTRWPVDGSRFSRELAAVVTAGMGHAKDVAPA